MKLSLIIAMFNIEKYIAECLNSCIIQKNVSFDDFEIIVVNDGSTDRSREIANDFLLKYDNIRIVDRHNGGLSAARNTGLLNARGEYVWFIDGDDKIVDFSVSFLIEKINKYHSDVYMVDYSLFYEGNTNTPKFNCNLPKEIFAGKKIMESQRRILPMMAWLSIYNRNYLLKERIAFTEGIIHEDLDFSVRSHYLAKSIFYTAESLYCYRMNSTGSIMSNVRKNYTKSVISYDIIQTVWSDFFKNKNVSYYYRKYLMGIISQFIMVRLYSGKVDSCQEIELIKSKRNRYIKFLWNFGTVKSKLFVLLVLFTPKRLCEFLCSKRID